MPRPTLPETGFQPVQDFDFRIAIIRINGIALFR